MEEQKGSSEAWKETRDLGLGFRMRDLRVLKMAIEEHCGRETEVSQGFSGCFICRLYFR